MRKPIIIVAAVSVAASLAFVVWWVVTPSYDETVKSCQKALVAQTKAGVTGKPSACSGVERDDYEAIVVANAIDGMSEKDRDMLDYYDNGTIDGSIG